MKENTLFLLLSWSSVRVSLVTSLLAVTVCVWCVLADVSCVYSLLLLAVLACSLSIKITQYLEERTAPLDIPIDWLSELLHIESILSAINLQQTAPTDQKCIAEDYFEKCLPVPWIVEIIG